jgi:hypothetical protein
MNFRHIIILAITIVLAETSNSQVTGLLGKKNIVSFQANVSPLVAFRKSVRLKSDTENRLYLNLFSFSFDLGYERILTRKISLGVDYSYGFGRMSMAATPSGYNYSGGTTSTLNLSDPIYQNHGLQIFAKFYIKDMAPLKTYLKLGIGASANYVNQTIKTGGIYGAPSNLDYDESKYYDYRTFKYYQTGEKLIKASRIFMNTTLAVGRNWVIGKRTMLNFEFGTKINFAVDGKNDFGDGIDEIINTHPLTGSGIHAYVTEKDVEKNLSKMKIRQDIIYFSFGFKFAL